MSTEVIVLILAVLLAAMFGSLGVFLGSAMLLHYLLTD